MCYFRQLFHASDGGTIALDWLLKTDGNILQRHLLNDFAADDTCQIH